MDLNEVAELSYNQIFPKGGDETAIDIVEFERTAFSEFAYQMLMMSYRQKADEGYFEVPSYLSAEKEFDVVNNEIDISGIDAFRSLPNDIWMQGVNTYGCDCKYVKSTVNMSQLLCDDDSLDDNVKKYIIVGNKIKFPNGAHKNKLSIMYANMGAGVDGAIEVDEAIAALVRERLSAIYLGKVPAADSINNSNPDK